LQSLEFDLIATDGVRLYGKSWIPGEPRAVICLVHGLGEHLGRYEHVAAHLVAKGFALYAYDQRGHGRSQGKRGHGGQEQLWNDVETVLKKARSQHLYLPLFLYGHSLGGNVVSSFLLRRNTAELTGAVITSPWLELSFKPSSWQVRLGKFMSRIFPSMTQPNRLDASHLSRDEQVAELYQSDPLVHDRISASLFVGATESGEYAMKNASTLKIPLLVMHGTDDRITSPQASERFANTSALATLKLWPEFRHETHNEIGKEQVLDFLTNWLDHQIP